MQGLTGERGNYNLNRCSGRLASKTGLTNYTPHSV
jgi:hypothetical protein